MKRLAVFAATLLACSGLSLMLARSPASQPAPTAVGSETCKDCHEEVWEAFQNNVHANAQGTETVGCESCHGPGSLHAGAAGDRSDPGFSTIRNLKTMPADQSAAVCRSCHVSGEQMYWDQSTHALKGMTCVNCHTIHGAKGEGAQVAMIVKPSVNELCMSCHKDKRSKFARSAHMPLREGSMNCADCHNPHGSDGPHMIRGASVNELCTTCHADKRGPFLWEHPPVRENCLNCHEPHGSNNSKVLASKKPFLCQRCHIATRHPATLYDAPDLTSNRLLNRSCTNCHANIHGSNSPSGKTFLR